MRNINKNNILELYYEKHFTRKQIRYKLNFSNTYITTIIKADPRYEQEKKSRKIKSKEKNSNETKQYIKTKRIQDSLIDAQLRQQHIQASIELSGGQSINNHAFRRWNSSAYKYNEKKKYFEFDKKLGKSYAVPKIIKY